MLKEIIKWGIYLVFILPVIKWFGFIGFLAWGTLYWVVIDFLFSEDDYEPRH
ncbi:hypothetical protein GNF18_05645 [Ligilactobacillus pobuzihii]|uniref:hypothetical protein n=1 Tax=Ligilactobacillus pobuzihii TaxID=449659 RepID=UPI0019D0F5EE|nr:hypothetical protein [Ligilactobacillus pobuzihii]MBN7274622.1 hypothetical protein [Ligilactobacillus pobuzihii]